MEWTPEAYEDHGLLPSLEPLPVRDGPRDVASALDAAVTQRPDAEALIGRYSRYTYREYEAAVNAAAAYLSELGLRPGDRIAASAGNHADIVIAFFAAMRLGAIWVGVNRRLAPAEKRYLLKHAEAKILLAEDEVIAELEPARKELGLQAMVSMEASNENSEWRCGLTAHTGAQRPSVRIDPWAPAAIAYTSGTTGFPKGAVHSQHNMILVTAAAQHGLAREALAARVYGTTTPLTILNLMILGPLAAARACAAHVCMDRVDALGVAEWIERERITTTTCAPTTAYDMLTRPDIRPEALASLQQLSIGGATVPEGLPALYAAHFGCRPRVGYGLTEAPTGVAATDGATPTLQGEIGRPMVQFEIEILDDDGARSPPGKSGEIAIRAAASGPFAGLWRPPLGYWRNGQATKKLLRGGWLHTDDVGFKDDNGALHIQDRRTDVITRGGSNVYPAEVERVLRMDPRVADCAVVGKPDARLGQVVVAFVEPAPGICDRPALVADLQALCRDNLAQYKLPVDWRVLEKLPRNVAGKVIRPRLKEMLEPAADAILAASPMPDKFG